MRLYNVVMRDKKAEIVVVTAEICTPSAHGDLLFFEEMSGRQTLTQGFAAGTWVTVECIGDAPRKTIVAGM